MGGVGRCRRYRCVCYSFIQFAFRQVQGITLFRMKRFARIRRIPPISSNQLSFPAYAQLNTHYHPLPNYCTFYGIIIGLHISISIRASYSASTCHPLAMGRNPPSSPLLPLAAWRSRRASLDRCTRREISRPRWSWILSEKVLLTKTFSG